MKTNAETTRAINEQALIEAIEALQPSRHNVQKSAFRKAYPLIMEKLSEGIKDSDIIKALAAQGILKSRNTYVKWMAEMEKAAQADVKEPSVVREAIKRVNEGLQ